MQSLLSYNKPDNRLTTTTIISPQSPPQPSSSSTASPTSTSTTTPPPQSPSHAAAIPSWIMDSFVFDEYNKRVNQVSQFAMDSKFIEATKKLVEYGNREFLRSFQLKPEIKECNNSNHNSGNNSDNNNKKWCQDHCSYYSD
jgi:hypothetical protein